MEALNDDLLCRGGLTARALEGSLPHRVLCAGYGYGTRHLHLGEPCQRGIPGDPLVRGAHG